MILVPKGLVFCFEDPKKFKTSYLIAIEVGWFALINCYTKDNLSNLSTGKYKHKPE